MVDEKKVITVFFLFYSFNVFSGDTSGISLYVKPLPSAMDYKYVVDGFFRNYYGIDNANTPSCNSNDYTPFVDVVYLNTSLKGVSNQELLQSIFSRDSRVKISRVLSEFKDDRVSGFDGVMF